LQPGIVPVRKDRIPVTQFLIFNKLCHSFHLSGNVKN
jgi:hypothetical protein